MKSLSRTELTTLQILNDFNIDTLEYIKGVSDKRAEFDTSFNIFFSRLKTLDKGSDRIETAYEMIEKHKVSWVSGHGWTMVYDEDASEEDKVIIMSHQFEINLLLSTYFLSPTIKAYVKEYETQLQSMQSIDRLVSLDCIMDLILSLKVTLETEGLLSSAMIEVIEMDKSLNPYQAFQIIIGTMINKFKRQE